MAIFKGRPGRMQLIMLPRMEYGWFTCTIQCLSITNHPTIPLPPFIIHPLLTAVKHRLSYSKLKATNLAMDSQEPTNTPENQKSTQVEHTLISEHRRYENPNEYIVGWRLHTISAA
jgi:hypothetical protein